MKSCSQSETKQAQNEVVFFNMCPLICARMVCKIKDGNQKGVLKKS